MFGVAIGIAILDRLCKLAVVRNMSLGQSIELVRGLIYITRVFNRGAAFGIMPGKTGVFTVVALVVILIIFGIKSRLGSAGKELNAALGLVLGGAFGNLYDRLTFGGVVDFIDIRVWPAVFNVADAAIVCGVLLFAIEVYRKAERA
ncbi:MAG TPA: signal peptidase II [Firmicutes bacterium]|nr:signal peptidase II [Bacillota bacterium]